MKKLISTAAFFFAALSFSMISANALYGGETLSYQFPRCDMLNVIITNSSLGEWNATPNCAETGAGIFSCGCTDGWTLNLTSAANAVGSYQISITNYADGASKTVTHSGYVSKNCKKENYVCSQFQSCCEGLACLNNICILNTTIPTTTATTTTTTTTLSQTTTVPMTTTTTMLPTESPPDNNLWLWSIVGVLLTPLIIWYLNGLRLKHKEKQLV